MGITHNWKIIYLIFQDPVAGLRTSISGGCGLLAGQRRDNGRDKCRGLQVQTIYTFIYIIYYI